MADLIRLKLITTAGRKAWVALNAEGWWHWSIDYRPYRGDQSGTSRSRRGAMVQARNQLCSLHDRGDYLTGKWEPDTTQQES